ncbi:MAG: serine hydrolase domain-containing protein, partial [Chloroflexota bacterium]
MSAPDSRTAPDEPEPTPPGVGLLPDRLARADDAARRLLARGVFSAVSLAVSRRGALVHERFFGTTRYAGSAPVTARSLFAIASVTKPLAAAAVMLLLERGLFHLGTPVTDLVPDFGHKGKKDVTVEHLLTHTSGISERWIDAVPCSTRDEYRARIRQAPLLWPAGSHVAYCSAAFSALEDVIEHTTGMPAAQFLADELFAPLGMADTHYQPAEAHHARLVECRRPTGQDMVRHLLDVGTLGGAIFSTVRA